VSQGTPTIMHLPDQGRHDWVEAYLTNVLATKDPQTQDAYARILLDFARWLPRQTGFHATDGSCASRGRMAIPCTGSEAF